MACDCPVCKTGREAQLKKPVVQELEGGTVQAMIVIPSSSDTGDYSRKGPSGHVPNCHGDILAVAGPAGEPTDVRLVDGR